MDSSSRLQGLTPAVVEALRQSTQALGRRDAAAAIRHAREAERNAPEHPEVLRRLALAMAAHGDSTDAIATIARAVAQRPDDAVLVNAQAIVLRRGGQRDAALAALAHAYALQPDSADIAYPYGRELALRGDSENARTVLERLLQLTPEHRDGRATLAMVLAQLGGADGAVSHYRHMLQRNPLDIRAWSALGALKSVRFDAADLAAMRRLAAQPALDFESRVRLAFTLAKACDDNGNYAEAYAEFCRANALMRERIPWNAQAHAQEVTAILHAFDKPAIPVEQKRGEGIVFIVSMPRSGSTLTEQILASHRDVAAGDERIDVLEIIAAEGRRRNTHFAAWAPLASEDDWRRLGEAYLARIAPARGSARTFTDKLPGNWLWLGAALAMLPGARVVDCRRDPLETAWSCFRQAFGGGGTQDFSYDFDSIAAFWKDYDRAMRHWRGLYAQRIRTQVYESLQADAEQQTRELLAFCGLDFDPACLRFHENRRRISTMSASQVREPLRRDTAQAAKYGALLDPLRRALTAAGAFADG